MHVRIYLCKKYTYNVSIYNMYYNILYRDIIDRHINIYTLTYISYMDML